jgi:hypothetical protein
MKKYPKNYSLLLTTLFISACGGGGGGGGNSTPPITEPPLSFANASPTVIAQGTSGIIVSAATNKANAEVSYIAVTTGNTQPNADDYFGDTPMPNRFSLTTTAANTLVAEENEESLRSSTTYEVYVAAKAGSETVVYPTPFEITTGDSIAWDTHCNSIDAQSISLEDIAITSADLSALDNILVINGTLSVSGVNVPAQLDLSQLVCARTLELGSAQNLNTLDLTNMKVIDSLTTTDDGTTINTLSLPALLSASRIKLSNVPNLTNISIAMLTALDELDIRQAYVLNTLSMPELQTISLLTINGSSLSDLTGLAKLEQVTQLTLTDLDQLSLVGNQALHIQERLDITNATNIQDLGNLKFVTLNRLSIVNTPLNSDPNDIYKTEAFSVSDVNIVGTEIQDINPLLLKMRNVDDLKLADNDAISNITFYQTENMETLKVSGHDLLQEISLPNVPKIGAIEISEALDTSPLGINPALETISFAGLTTTADIVIKGNAALTTLSVPELVEVVPVSGSNRCDFYKNGTADMVFPELVSASCRFWFRDSNMKTISFPKLTTISDEFGSLIAFTVGDGQPNVNLESIRLPELTTAVDHVFKINDNPALVTIDADKLTTVRAMNINNNISFNQCEASAIWTRLGEVGGTPTGNDTPPEGC